MLQSVQLVDPDSRFCFAILHLLEGRIAPGCVTDIERMREAREEMRRV